MTSARVSGRSGRISATPGASARFGAIPPSPSRLTYGGWKDSKHPKELVDLLTWVATNPDNQKNAVTVPADKPASIQWGAKLKADGYYAADDVFDVELKAADYGNPGYGTLRFSPADAIAKIVSPQLANGSGKLVDLLPALQQELENGAKVAGYQVEP